jgi:hypothetical protein
VCKQTTCGRLGNAADYGVETISAHSLITKGGPYGPSVMLFMLLSMHEQVIHDTSIHKFERSESRICHESKALK